MDQLTNLITNLEYFLVLLVVVGVAVVVLGGLFYLIALWMKFKNRERQSLESVLLQIALPRDNETKIDVAEQMFASLYSIKKRW